MGSEMCIRDSDALVDGTPQTIDENIAARILAEEDIVLDIDLRGGTWGDRATSGACYWTCDLSKEYITVRGN